jgi:hypothetical protein
MQLLEYKIKLDRIIDAYLRPSQNPLSSYTIAQLPIWTYTVVSDQVEGM